GLNRWAETAHVRPAAAAPQTAPGGLWRRGHIRNSAADRDRASPARSRRAGCGAPATRRPQRAPVRPRRPSTCSWRRARAPTRASPRSISRARPAAPRPRTERSCLPRDRARRTHSETAAARRSRTAATRGATVGRSAHRGAPARTVRAAPASAPAPPRRARRAARRRSVAPPATAQPRPARRPTPPSVLEDGVNRVAGELGASVQRDQLDEEGEGVHFPTEAGHQLGGRARGAARGQQVVDDQHPLPLLHRIVVNLERIGAVLEGIGRGDALRRQLARLAHGREPRADAIGDGGAEDEPAALDADDEIDPLVPEREREAVDGGAEAGRVLHQRGDVVEEDAGLGEIGDVANLAFQIIHGQVTEKPVSRPAGSRSSTSTWSTRAPGGPWRSARSKRSIASASPSASASTRRSGRLRTQPCTPSRSAVSRAKYLNPTAWTRPVIRNRLATRTGDDNREGDRARRDGWKAGRRNGKAKGAEGRRRPPSPFPFLAARHDFSSRYRSPFATPS